MIYKLTSNGLRFWEAQPDGCDLHVRYGYVGGETTSNTLGYDDEQECQTEADRRRTHKLQREGYTKEIPTEIPSLPMDAQQFRDHSGKLPETVLIQPKLDGIRCIGTSEGLFSKRDSVLQSCPHVSETLSDLPLGIRLDGELYCHRLSFQEHLRLIKRDRVLKECVEKVRYHVYDMVADLPFRERIELVKTIVKKLGVSEVVSVPTYLVNKNEVIEYAESYFGEYEGVMVRDPDSPYEESKRSYFLQKYPFLNHEEFQIVDIVDSGKGKEQGCALYVCKTKEDHPFTARPALSLEKRGQVLRSKEMFIGMWTRIKFKGYTDKGIPRCAIAEGCELNKEDFQ